MKDEAAKLSLSLAALGQFKPSLVIVTMTSLKLQQMGISSDGVDMYYFNKGKEAGKDLGYLESIDLQIDVLMSMGEGNEDEFVKYSDLRLGRYE